MGAHPASSSVGHRSRPHTADLIIEAWAPTWEGCLVEAVAAVTDSYADTTRADTTGRHEFHFTTASTEQALVSLLDEVIYLVDARGAVVVGTHLEPIRDSTVTGWFDLTDVDTTALIGSVPKGIALSGLQVRRTAGGWRCTATVDV